MTSPSPSPSASPFLGSVPYCYSNSLAMVLGADAPPPSAIEVLTGSPFGAQVVEGALPYFDPLGWEPDLGLDQAVGLLGWSCRKVGGGEETEAVARLREACGRGPVLVGPVDIGLLLHQPWAGGTAIGGDHWVVALDVDDERVLFHDPDGFPYATLPVDAFVAAWRAEKVECAGPFTMRSDFERVRDVDGTDALRQSLPVARRWLAEHRGGPALRPGALGGDDAVERLAEWVEGGVDDRTHGHLAGFAVRLGARRLSDASYWLAQVGADRAAEVAHRQARLLGGVQYGLVTGDRRAVASGLRQLVGTYGELTAALDG
ncbi:hypothetical protein [Streptomyces sp. NPDC046862]|uniref:hypothetical protein n=1 Tax=Streptomyces sp. NPDC046862 TaxID=3154603 RepID=UPI003456D5EF